MKMAEAIGIWVEHLRARGHRIERRGRPIISRSPDGKRCLWLIYRCGRDERIFRRHELRALLRLARWRRRVYVVVFFTHAGRVAAADARVVRKNPVLSVRQACMSVRP